MTTTHAATDAEAAINQHAGDPERLRASILAAPRYDA